MRKENQRANYLIKNTVIFTIGNLATKFISFFLVPLYTNTLSTTEYGTVDLVSTICNVLAPIMILNISESVMRFSLDREADYSQILSIGILIYFFSLILGLLIFPINSLVPLTDEYSIYIYFNTVMYAGSQLFLCYLRGKERLAAYAIGGVIQTLTLACFNIFFLLNLKLGIHGYFLSMILSSAITMFYAGVSGKVWTVIYHFSINKNLFMQMVKYSIVLIPNTFMWWIMNASDRIMVTAIVGAAANGIYAISYKLPTLVSTFTGIFNQAWSYSAIKEEGSEDEVEFNNKVLNTLISFSMLVGIGLLTVAKPFLKLYVSFAYFEAWRYIPFLTIGCIYLTLGTFMATSYTVHKDSFGYLFSAMFGAVFNIALNFWLIPAIGVYGAAIATCVSYIAVFVFRAIHTKKYIRYKILTVEFIVGSILLLVTSFLMFFENMVGFIIQIGLFIIAVYFYAQIWVPILKEIFRRV
ncbi:MAG: oligosaccharide flippase family protein [Hungatella sp.]|nr:oligosaccharide flippase family protein [Hungatella sp.]